MKRFWILPLTIVTALSLCVGLTACKEVPSPHVHSFGADNVCEGCSEAWDYTEGLEYTPGSDGTYAVSGIGEASGDVVIPYGYNGAAVTSIGERAFYHCAALTGITLPDSITSIDDAAFYGCAALTGIVIPDSVTFLGERAFEQCAGLTEAIVGDGVRRIDYYTFGNCAGLTRVALGRSVAALGHYAFFGCTELASIEVAGENTTYRSEGNCLIERAANKLVLGCKTSVIPSGVTAIGYQAFYACRYLTGVILPVGVTVLDDWAFGNCPNLTGVVLPDGVTSLGGAVFAGCSELKSIVIPKSVTSIGDWAFQLCSGLEAVYYTGTEQDWDTIEMSADANAELFGAARYFYSEAPDYDGRHWHYDADGITPVVWAAGEETAVLRRPWCAA